MELKENDGNKTIQQKFLKKIPVKKT